MEEVIRINGYENIPTVAPKASLVMSLHNETHIPLNRVKNALVNKGFQEVVCYSFVDPKLQDYLHKGEESFNLPNPISIEMSQMRLSMFTGLLTTLSYNQKRQQKRVRIFETGLTFIPNANSELGVNQKEVVAGLLAGSRDPESWLSSNEQVDFFDAKGVVEDLLSLTDNYKNNQVKFIAQEVKGFHPGQTAVIYVNDKQVGVVGKLHPSLAKPFGVSGNIFLFSLDQEALSQTFVPQITPVSKFQANKRDISLIVDKETPIGELLLAAKQANAQLLTDVQLFDVFEGDALGADKKSVALTLTIGAQERTLEDSDINEQVELVVKSLAEKFKAVLREV